MSTNDAIQLRAAHGEPEPARLHRLGALPVPSCVHSVVTMTTGQTSATKTVAGNAFDGICRHITTPRILTTVIRR